MNRSGSEPAVADDAERWSHDLAPARTPGWQRRQSATTPPPDAAPTPEDRLAALEGAMREVVNRLGELERAMATGFQEGASAALAFAEGTDELLAAQAQTLERIERSLRDLASRKT